MKRIISTAVILVLPLIAAVYLSGCVATALVPLASVGYGYSQQQKVAESLQQAQNDNDLMMQKMKITTEFNNNPDTDAWHEQRQKIAQTTGDRTFDKDFARVYDSLVLATSTMELKVNNMERTSGYIQASGISLPPTEAKAMRSAALREWCGLKGYDASILDRKYASPQFEKAYGTTDDSASMFMKDPSAKTQKSVTFQLVKLGADQTKVKLRFSDVNYPAEMEAYYKMLWQAVDKQIFVDKNIEGAVEERK